MIDKVGEKGGGEERAIRAIVEVLKNKLNDFNRLTEDFQAAQIQDTVADNIKKTMGKREASKEVPASLQKLLDRAELVAGLSEVLSDADFEGVIDPEIRDEILANITMFVAYANRAKEGGAEALHMMSLVGLLSQPGSGENQLGMLINFLESRLKKMA